MNKMDVSMCENRGYSDFSHSYTLKAVDPTMILFGIGEDVVVGVDVGDVVVVFDDDDTYW